MTLPLEKMSHADTVKAINEVATELIGYLKDTDLSKRCTAELLMRHELICQTINELGVKESPPKSHSIWANPNYLTDEPPAVIVPLEK